VNGFALALSGPTLVYKSTGETSSTDQAKSCS
jgi:hypothetical protein